MIIVITSLLSHENLIILRRNGEKIIAFLILQKKFKKFGLKIWSF